MNVFRSIRRFLSRYRSFGMTTPCNAFHEKSDISTTSGGIDDRIPCARSNHGMYDVRIPYDRSNQGMIDIRIPYDKSNHGMQDTDYS